mgnify:FL=1
MKAGYTKQLVLSTLLIFLSINSSLSFEVKKDKEIFISHNFQDKTILIKKIKNRISSLKSKKEKLVVLKKWSDARERVYVKQIEKLENGLKKLGYKEVRQLTVKEKIKKLQKELKYLNNNKTSERNKNNWSLKDEQSYQKKATVFIDSIIKLRMIKN